MTKPTLDELLELASKYEWTDERRRENLINLAYANVKLHNPEITREEVEAWANKLLVTDQPSE